MEYWRFSTLRIVSKVTKDLIKKIHDKFFNEPGFGLDSASMLLGDVVDQKNTARIDIKSKDENISSVVAAMNEGFVESISFEYSNPIHATLTSLDKAYGTPRHIPRLKPKSAFLFQYQAPKNSQLQGYMLLGLTSEKEQTSISIVRFVRFAPDENG